jgi:hypothetical protein
VTSWIVPVVEKTKNDPRSHTNQHEPKHSCLELGLAFEAKLGQGRLSPSPNRPPLSLNPLPLRSILMQLRIEIIRWVFQVMNNSNRDEAQQSR